jgi:ABC-type bacteriocin/lantibiotic exporter with double-glycine peptidase domain
VTAADLYRAIWRVTGRQQLLLIVLSLLVAGLAAVPLKLQQLVVNDFTYGGGVRRLAWLCLAFLAAVLLSAGLKFLLGLRLSVAGEGAVRLIRERLYRNAVGRAGEPPQRGSLVAMLAAEAEAVGAFAGSAIATPLLQVGTLASVIGFIALSQPWLGLLALAVVAPQAAIVVGLQKRINARVKERVQHLRDVADRISAADLAAVDEAVLADFAAIYETRRRLFLLKLSSKFLLGAIGALGKVGILFLGGWLVLRGRSDVGTVVASLAGLTRIDGPWRELIAFFRQASVVRVKFGLLAGPLGLAAPAQNEPKVEPSTITATSAKKAPTTATISTSR